MPTLMINGRELVRKNLSSLGYILTEVIPLFSEKYHIVVLIPKGELNYEARGIFSRYNVQTYLVNSQCESYLNKICYYSLMYYHIYKSQPDYFWEVNHIVGPTHKNTLATVTIHDFFPMYSELNKSKFKKIIFKLGIRCSIACSNAAFFPTKQTESEFIARYPDACIPTKVIHNGITSNTSSDAPQIESLDRDLTVGYIGRINHWKGIDRLLKNARASPLVKNVILAGSVDQEYVSKIRNDNPEILDNVKFLGVIPNSQKDDFFKSIDVFVYPTRFDGFGIPPLEAMNNFVPTFVSNIPVMREVCKDYAFYLNVHSADEFNAELQKLKDLDYKQRSDHLHRSRMHSERYCWQRYVTEFSHEIDKLKASA